MSRAFVIVLVGLLALPLSASGADVRSEIDIESFFQLDQFRKHIDFKDLQGGPDELTAFARTRLVKLLPKDEHSEDRNRNIGAVLGAYVSLTRGVRTFDNDAAIAVLKDDAIPFTFRSRAAGLLFSATGKTEYLTQYLLGDGGRYSAVGKLDAEVVLAAVRGVAVQAYAEGVNDVEYEKSTACQSIGRNLAAMVQILDTGHNFDKQTAQDLLSRGPELLAAANSMHGRGINSNDVATSLLSVSEHRANDYVYYLLRGGHTSELRAIQLDPALQSILTSSRERLKQETKSVLDVTAPASR